MLNSNVSERRLAHVSAINVVRDWKNFFQSNSRSLKVLLYALPLVIIVVLATHRWQRYGDVQVDFGHELYVAWRLASGDVLYRDIAYFKGPFSPYWNALSMKILGSSMRTIVLSNLLVITAIAYGIQHWVSLARGRVIGTVLACVYIIVIAFNVTYMDIFNFVTPFVHELTHGILLSIFAVIALEKYARSRRTFYTFLSGIAFGCALLTRVEFYVSLGVACLVWCYCLHKQHVKPYRPICAFLCFVFAALVVVLSAIALLGVYMPLEQAVQSIFRTATALWSTSIMSSPFFRAIGGRDHPVSSILYQLCMSLLMFFWLLNLFAASDFFRSRQKFPTAMFVLMACAEISLLVLFVSPPLLNGIPLLLTTIVIAVVAWMRLIKRHKTDAMTLRVVMVTTTFALMMLLKIALLPSIDFYGFAHGMPAYILLFGVLLTESKPFIRKVLDARAAQFFSAAICAVLVIEVGAHFIEDQWLIEGKYIAVGAGSDRIYVADNIRTRAFTAFLKAAPDLISPHSTMAVVPEGAMLNFLLRIPSSVPVTNYMRTEYILFGQEFIEGGLRKNPPDYIALTHKDTSAFGYQFFGRSPEYGADVIALLHEQYTSIALFGKKPLTDRHSWGIELWKRNGQQE